MTSQPPQTKAIAVHVRVRPATEKDGPSKEDALAMDPIGGNISAVNATGDRRTTFDSSTQEDVWAEVSPILEQVYKGVNATIFAYGVTGAGKTHTMQGSKAELGIIPRVVKAVFHKRARLRKSTMAVSFSYVEILKDEVYDLLGQRIGAKKLDVRTDSAGNNVIADMTISPLSSTSEFDELYASSAKYRKTASTNLNSSSSRSHAILTLYLEITENGTDKTLCGKICLTDLAGSENNNLTGNDRERMLESSAINKSLTVLGNVVDAINKGASRIPYRDSKLTRILQDALGGSSLGLLFCCLAPGEKFARDTLNTLKFAERARGIENRVSVNERVVPVSTVDVKPRMGMASLGAPSRPGAAFKVHRESDVASRPGAGSSSTAVRAGVLRPQSVGNKENIRGNVQVPASLKGGKGEMVITPEELEKQVNTLFDKRWAEFEREKKEKGQAGIAQETKQSQIAAAAKKALLSPPLESTKPSSIENAPSIPISQAEEEEAQSLSSEAKKARAHVLVDRARQHHKENELPEALAMYRKAQAYAPQNAKLAKRITEIEMAIEGLISAPQLSHRTIQHLSRAASVDPQAPLDGQNSNFIPRDVRSGLGAAGGGKMKRSRAPLQSLAELSYGAATDEDEEGESDDDDDDGQRRDRQLKKRKMKGGKGRGDDSAEYLPEGRGHKARSRRIAA